LPSPASAALSDQDRAERAVGYIAKQQQEDGSIPAFSPIGSTADSVLAFVATGRGKPAMRDALDYLRAQVEAGNVNTLGLKAKVVLAWTSAGRSARNIAGQNLAAPLRTGLSTPDGESVLDVALAVLAVESAGKDAPGGALVWLADAQCPDGGWAYDAPYDSEVDDEHCYSGDGDWFMSDTNTTAYALMALAAGNGAVPSFSGNTPWDFFRSIRDTGYGGWGYTWGYETTDANSTALVLQAYAAAGRDAPSGSLPALRGLQYGGCGAFAFTYSDGEKGAPDVGATIGAVPGILGKAFPYTGPVEGPAPSTPPCPGV
jgi:hypothetical protein